MILNPSIITHKLESELTQHMMYSYLIVTGKSLCSIIQASRHLINWLNTRIFPSGSYTYVCTFEINMTSDGLFQMANSHDR